MDRWRPWIALVVAAILMSYVISLAWDPFLWHDTGPMFKPVMVIVILFGTFAFWKAIYLALGRLFEGLPEREKHSSTSEKSTPNEKRRPVSRERGNTTAGRYSATEGSAPDRSRNPPSRARKNRPTANAWSSAAKDELSDD